jgi:hypothetical protein
MNKENKVISIAVGDRLQIEGVGTVELVVVAPEQNEQSKQHPLVGKWVRYWFTEWKHAPIYNKWFQIESVEIRDVQKGKEWWITVTDKDTFKEPTRNEVWNGINPQTCCFDLSNPYDFDCNMPEAVNPKFKVGDEVVVVDKSKTYEIYKQVFWYLGLKNKKNNYGFVNGTKATVFNVCGHEDQEDTNLYALRDSEGNECVIGEEGIKLAGINKQEWLDAASRLFDSWMKISGGYVPKEEGGYFVKFDVEENRLYIDDYYNLINPFSFQSNQQAEQFIQENEKDLKTFFHQV